MSESGASVQITEKIERPGKRFSLMTIFPLLF